MPEALFYFVPSVGSKFKFDGLPDQVVPVFAANTPRRSVHAIPARVSIRHFPLKSLEALTVHKSQGNTFIAICIDEFSKKYPNASYVALSRIVESACLFISPNAEITPELLYQFDRAAFLEIERLVSLEIGQ